MAVVLVDGKPGYENVMLLKQALAIFPAFHEEISGILTELSTSGGEATVRYKREFSLKNPALRDGSYANVI